MADDQAGAEGSSVNEAKEDIEVVKDVWPAQSSPPLFPPGPAIGSATSSLAAPSGDDEALGPQSPDGLTEDEREGRRADRQLEEEQRGCAKYLGVSVLVAALVLVVVGILVFAFTRDSDTDKKAGAAGAAAPGANSSSKSADGVAAFAGHWTRSSGLDDPTGVDEDQPAGVDAVTLGPRSASFDIAEDGTISAGTWHSEHVDHAAGCDYHYALDGATAKGSVGDDGRGIIAWTSSPSIKRDCADSGTASPVPFPRLSFLIDGNTLYACRAPAGNPVCGKSNANGVFTRSSL